LAIEQGLSEYDATDKELSLTVPEIVRQMDDFQLRNAGGILAASLSGRILALRNAASKEREDEISLEEANRIVDENLAKKKAKEDAEAEKRRAEEEWEAAHANEI
jgi:hypothetical protein